MTNPPFITTEFELRRLRIWIANETSRLTKRKYARDRKPWRLIAQAQEYADELATKVLRRTIDPSRG
jgi:hypothetical protein